MFVNMTGFWLCVGMQLWKDSAYSRIPSMPGFCVYKRCTRFWIWLFNVSQGFQQASSSKYARAQNMTRLGICEGYTGCWICLNKPEYTLMPQYAWICLNNAEYHWMCRHLPEKTESWICQNFECVWCST